MGSITQILLTSCALLLFDLRREAGRERWKMQPLKCIMDIYSVLIILQFSVEGLVALIENNPTIEVLVLPYGFYFEDKLVEAILRNLGKLRRITLGVSCLQFTFLDELTFVQFPLK